MQEGVCQEMQLEAEAQEGPVLQHPRPRPNTLGLEAKIAEEGLPRADALNPVAFS